MSHLSLEKGKARGNSGELMGLEAAKANKSGKRWIQRSRQHPDPSLPSTAAPEQRGFVSCGTVTAGEVMARGSGHEPQWPRLHTNKCPCTKQVPCQRASHGAELGMVLSLPGSLQGTPTPPTLASQPISLVLFTGPTTSS